MMKHSVDETAYREKHGHKPTGTETWIFFYYSNDELMAKFSVFGNYADATIPALRFRRLGGYEEVRLRA